MNNKKLFIRFRPFFVFIVLILTLLSCFAAYMLDANDNQDKYIAKWEGEAVDDLFDEVKSTPDVINPVPLSEKENDSYFEGCSFVKVGDISVENQGNSIAERLTANYGVSNKPKYYYYFPDIKTDFTKIDLNSDGYICAVFPIDGALETDTFNNKIIDEYNSSILAFANEKGYAFLDTNTVLKGIDGKLDPEYVADNGNINDEGLEVIKSYILTHIQ
ncbi:MAG: hypothetical protein LBM93_04095 [Oscillospiraceae bacterium]|jgi:hypothetical protein|nr:hypothetical protein [Oscillospiraceae bacterium]